jgi:CheY-like chemotaxis protein
MIQELLELYGQFEFEVASDGCEAIEKLSGPLPDLVLLDLRLPGLDGLTVLDAIRNVDSRLPVIVVSAYGDKRTRQEAARRGANDFFQKPFGTHRLYRRIRQLLATAPDPLQTHDLSGREIAVTLYKAKQRRLLKLQERQAQLGHSTPPELLIEIEDLVEELDNLERKLKNAYT